MAEYSGFHDFRSSRARDQLSSLKTRHAEVEEVASEASNECRTLSDTILSKRNTESEIVARRDLLEMRMSRLTQSLAEARRARESANDQLKSSTSILQESRNAFSRAVMKIAEDTATLMKTTDTQTLKLEIERLQNSISASQNAVSTLQKGRMSHDEAKAAKRTQVHQLGDKQSKLVGDIARQNAQFQSAEEEHRKLNDKLQQLTKAGGNADLAQHTAEMNATRAQLSTVKEINANFDEAKVVEDLCADAKKALDAAKASATKKTANGKGKAAGGAKNDAEQTKYREEVQRFDWMRAALIRNLRDVSSDIFALVRDLEKVQDKTPTCLICKNPVSSDEYVSGIMTDIQTIGKEIDAVPPMDDGATESQIGDGMSQVAG